MSTTLDTYEAYLKSAQSTYNDIYTEQTKYYDQQNKESLAAIEEQKQADLSYATNQYQILVDAINKAKESGTKLAKEQYDLLMNMSEEQRQTVYKAAEEQRAESYRLAEIERERGVVDARTSYAQNMATYGAKAEQVGRMGLSGSGYSDYLNSQAYATQRAETQAANAQSETAKREARYAENQAKLDADLSYSQNKYNAESQYSKDMYEVDTSYSQNMADADSKKSTAVHEAESTARADTLTANQTAAAGKHEASLTYQENLLANEGQLAQYQQQKADEAAAKAEAEAETRRNAYVSLLAAANNGDYTATQIESVAKEYGLSTSQIENLKNAAAAAAEKKDTDVFLDPDEIAETERQENNDYIKDKIESGEYRASDIEDAYISGYINQPDYEQHLLEYENKVKGDTARVGNAYFDNDTFVTTDGKAGNNFTVRVGNDTYKVQYAGGATDDADVLAAANYVENNEIFGYDYKIYIKRKNKIYEIEGRPSNNLDYEMLEAMFFKTDEVKKV